MPKKQLKFAKELVPLVISGEKTSTWRLYDDKDLQVNDVLDLVDASTGEVFSGAVITAIQEKTLGEISPNDFAGHGKPQSTDELVLGFKRMYGENVRIDTPVKLVDFILN